MKRLSLFLLVVSIGLIACNEQESLEEPIVVNDNCGSYIPFYEQQDSTVLSLNIECNCTDSFVDLSTKLAPYMNVLNINFNCNTSQFDRIPTMPSVTHLTSNVTTSNVSAFPNLEVYRNKSFTTMPLAYQLRFLPNLREITLFNAINFPDFIKDIPLDVFKITFQGIDSEIISLPSNLPSLSNLKELNIRNVNLSIFTDFENLISLEKLTLSNTLWVRIPSVPNQWSKLKTLDLSALELRGSGDIPDFFDDMDSLETVYISEMEVTTNTQKHIAKATSLKELTLSFCDLGTIPDEIGNLVHLNKLIITTNQNILNAPITLPLSVGNLSNLKSIFVSTNTDQFPVALFGLKNTIETIAIQDEIGVVPPEIGDFTALKTLKLNNCGLTNLPSEIQNLASTLEKLHLAGNSFDEVTQQQIKNWLPSTTIYF